MIREYVNNVNATQDSWFASDPYYYIRIDAIDHGTGGIQKFSFTSFEASEATKTSKEGLGSFSWVQMKDSSTTAAGNITLTKNITIPSDGLYLVEMILTKGPKAAKTGNNITLEVSKSSPLYNHKIYDESGYRQWDDYGCVVKCPPQQLSSGTNLFTLTLPKYTRAGWIKVSKITRYETGEDFVGDSETRLDPISCQFTQNGVNNLDACTLKVALKEDYFTERYSQNPLGFEMGDSITVVLGEDNLTARPMFGGYIQGWEINDEFTELTIYAIDRLWDLKRAVVWKNFYIGSKPTDEPATGSMPFSYFSSVNQIARYLSTCLYEIDYNSIDKEYIIYNSFSDITDVTSLTYSGFDLTWMTDFGHPGTSMRIIPRSAGTNTVTLYSSTDGEWDATEYETLAFDYYASGAGVKYPLKFNVEIEMYKSNEEPDGAQTYVINFNGPTATRPKKLLADVNATLNGQWQKFTINLNSAFDKVAPSNNYYIKSIKLVGQQDNNAVLNRRCSSLYIDNVLSYKLISQAPEYKSADSKTALEELQDLCEKTKHVAYTRPGMSRDEDVMILLPKRYYTIPITIDDTNVTEINNYEYKPLEWDLMNIAVDTYNIKDKKNVLQAKYYDTESDLHYGIIMDHEFHSDSTYTSAYTEAKARITNNSFKLPGFDLTMLGSTLIEPGQLVEVRLPKYHIYGAYEIAAITHNIDFQNNYFDSEIEFERPSARFKSLMATLKKVTRDLESIRNTAAYASAGALASGMETSLGAYEN